MTDRKAVVKNADMSEDMQQDAIECATQAMEKFNIEKDIAAVLFGRLWWQVFKIRASIPVLSQPQKCGSLADVFEFWGFYCFSTLTALELSALVWSHLHRRTNVRTLSQPAITSSSVFKTMRLLLWDCDSATYLTRWGRPTTHDPPCSNTKSLVWSVTVSRKSSQHLPLANGAPRCHDWAGFLICLQHSGTPGHPSRNLHDLMGIRTAHNLLCSVLSHIPRCPKLS